MSLALDEPTKLRNALVDNLVADGHIRSAPIERAMRSVPRHAFIPEASTAEAYENRAIPIENASGAKASSLSAPIWVANMLEELSLSAGMRILEVGAGTGYHAALMAKLVGPTGRVVTVEIEPWLVERAGS
jgi:protein-L-isoaspartate(D-aspartate) O-methyltransferase